MRARLELRRSNAARPHKNRKRDIGRAVDPTTCYCGDAECPDCMDWLDD